MHFKWREHIRGGGVERFLNRFLFCLSLSKEVSPHTKSQHILKGIRLVEPDSAYYATGSKSIAKLFVCQNNKSSGSPQLTISCFVIIQAYDGPKKKERMTRIQSSDSCPNSQSSDQIFCDWQLA